MDRVIAGILMCKGICEKMGCTSSHICVQLPTELNRTTTPASRTSIRTRARTERKHQHADTISDLVTPHMPACQPKAKNRRYRGDNYWEKETPLKVTTDKARLCYYPTAGKLQISWGWKNPDSGKVRYGRTVVLDRSAVASSPEAFSLFETFLNQARS